MVAFKLICKLKLVKRIMQIHNSTQIGRVSEKNPVRYYNVGKSLYISCLRSLNTVMCISERMAPQNIFNLKAITNK